MTRMNRAIMTFVLVGLLTPGLSWAERASGEGAAKTYLISGMVGAPGVTLKGLPGDPVSDPRGLYSVPVDQGWSGTVTPTREGYVFEPPERRYNSVQEDLSTENYTAVRLTFTISGNVGAPGVRLSGFPGEPAPVSDPQGVYKASVLYGWSGEVKPSRRGYSFTPRSRRYERIMQDRVNEDYTANVPTVTISDTIRVGEEPVANVLVTAEPGGYSTLTDSGGNYRIKVPYEWSGLITFTKAGYDFDPAGIPYEDVTTDLVRGKQTTGASDREMPVRPQAIPTYPPAGVASPTDDVLIIPTWEVDLKDNAETREDMQVMLHILREKLSEPRTILGTLHDYGDFFGGGGRDVQAIYLQGYAALFVMEVDFPLSFPSEPSGEGEPQEREPVDPVWQRARQQLYAPPGIRRHGTRGQPGGTDGMSFEQFKEDLVKALRHAANIRNVEPNEWIILTVVGRGESGFGIASSAGGMRGMMGGYGGGMMGGGGWVQGGGYSTSGGSVSGGTGSFGGRGGFYMDSRSSSRAPRGRLGSRLGQSQAPASTTVLTIQAKKADIDALARDDIDLEEFRQKVKVWTY